jgi:DNA-binding NtrC family response regulator
VTIAALLAPGPGLTEPLIAIHRRTLVPAVVVGGSSRGRSGVARLLHRESPVRDGRFVRVDSAREEVRLRAALESWRFGAESVRRPGPVLDAAGGTLFVDNVETLSPATQRLLLALASCRLDESESAPRWPGRMILGNPRDLAADSAQGRFLSELWDCVDKLRVDLAARSR